MAGKEVACPGCGATAKVPDGVAGKKVKCKKCGSSFRLPGGDPLAESVGDPEMLSTLDSPLTSPLAEPAAEPNPFDFSLLDAPAEPEPPRAKPARPPEAEVPRAKPAGAKSTPKAPPLPEPPKASKSTPEAVPVAIPAPPKVSKSKSTPKAPPVPAARRLPDPQDVPTAAPVDDPPPPKAKPAAEPPPPAAADAFSLDDAEEPAAASSADPFSFDAPAKPASASKSRPKAKALPPAEDEPKPAARSGYHRPPPAAGGGSKKLLLIIGALALFLLGGGVVGLIVYMSMKPPAEQAKADPKDKDGPPEPPPPDPPKDDTKSQTGKGTGKPPPNQPSKRTPVGGAGGPMLALPPGKPVAFQPPGAKPELAQVPQPTIIAVEAEFATVRRVFPPQKPDLDTGVLWQSKPGFQGKGEILTLDMYSTTIGSRVAAARIEMDGEDRPDPLCDLSANATVFALAANGKVSVWNVPDKKKLLDGFEPYADKPDHAKAGLAAVYLSEPPDVLVTVSTAGAVHAWEVSTKKPLGEFMPTKSVPNKVAAGKAVAIHPGRQSVVVMSGGTLYQVAFRPAVAGSEVVSLGGDVGRSLGLAVSGSGKVVFAFETDADGKKEKAVMAVRPSGMHVIHRWPDQAGEPVGAGWAGDRVATVPTARGAAVWFEAEEDNFRPLALVQVPGEKARHATAEDHWTLMPASDPKRSLLFEMTMPPTGLIDPLLTTNRPVFTLRLDEKGLWK